MTTNAPKFEMQISWDAKADANRKEFRVYLSDSENQKGDLVGTTRGDLGTATVKNVQEGVYWLTVLGVSREGVEEDWELAEARDKVVVTRRKETPSSLVNASAAPAVSSSSLVVQVDPPSKDEPPTEVEVLVGDDEDTGVLEAVVPVERGEEYGEDGEGLASVPIVRPPGLGSGNTEKLFVRGRTPTGKTAGAATEIDVHAFDLPGHFSETLASLVGNVLTNVISPGTTEGWEVDATDGARLKRFPTGSGALPAEWGQGNSGLLASQKFGQCYCNEGVIRTDELDLGAERDVVLECFDQTRLKTATGEVPTKQGTNLAHFPWFPTADPERWRESAEGPQFLTRWIKGTGKPRRPIPPRWRRWEIRYGTVSPLATDWMRYVPMIRIRARYVEARLTVRNPIGWHQLIVPKIYVRAWTDAGVEIKTKSGSDFLTTELDDIEDASKPQQFGIRTDAGGESIQFNIAGSIKKATLS